MKRPGQSENPGVVAPGSSEVGWGGYQAHTLLTRTDVVAPTDRKWTRGGVTHATRPQ